MEINKIAKISDLIYVGSSQHIINETDEFKKINFDVLINCSKNINYPDEIKNKYFIISFPFEDDIYATLLEYIDEVDDIIHKYILENKKIFVHCYNGLSISPAIIIYYLMLHNNYIYDDAYDFINNLIPNLDINNNFESELRQIEIC